MLTFDETSCLTYPDVKLIQDYFGRVRVDLGSSPVLHAGVLVEQRKHAVVYMLEGDQRGTVCAVPLDKVYLSTEFYEARARVARVFKFEMKGNCLLAPEGYSRDGSVLTSIGDGDDLSAYAWGYDPFDERKLPDGSRLVEATTLAREARRRQAHAFEAHAPKAGE